MQKVLILNGKFKEKIWGGDRLKKEFNYDINSNSIGCLLYTSPSPRDV